MADAAVQVFISYNRQDAIAVAPLVAALKARGVALWIDQEQILPGRPGWNWSSRACKPAPPSPSSSAPTASARCSSRRWPRP